MTDRPNANNNRGYMLNKYVKTVAVSWLETLNRAYLQTCLTIDNVPLGRYSFLDERYKEDNSIYQVSTKSYDTSF